jgi:hypothetical protein
VALAGYELAVSGAGSGLGARASGYYLVSPGDGCVIKGNVSSSGERIYHLPGQEYYSRTHISISRGERMFCSEDEARRAGWRKAKV